MHDGFFAVFAPFRHRFRPFIGESERPKMPLFQAFSASAPSPPPIKTAKTVETVAAQRLVKLRLALIVA
jgi:hypothetical protein